MDKSIEREIHKIYMSVFKKIFKEVQQKSKGKKILQKDIEKEILQLSKSDKYKEFAKEFSIKLAKKGIYKQKGLWRKYYEAAKKAHYGVLPDTYSDFELSVFREATENNFKMITSIPKEVMEVFKQKFVKELIEEVAQGKIARGSFRRQLQKHGVKHAQLVARTETAKLQTVITQKRATDLGSVAYIWRASNDKRTRPSHRQMNDVVVFWRSQEQKPLLDNMRGNAGEFPNCRCDPHPLFKKGDLKKSIYKVYDYRTDMIITMTKIDLIQALERGEL